LRVFARRRHQETEVTAFTQTTKAGAALAMASAETTGRLAMGGQTVSVTSDDRQDHSTAPAENVQNPPATAGEVQGYSFGLPGPLSAAEPPPGTTDPYGPPVPGRDLPARVSLLKPLFE
jgi:hypothetical protein